MRIAIAPSASGATSTQLPSALLRRLLIQRASSWLARTPFRTPGTAVSLLFTCPAALGPAVRPGAGRVRPGAPAPIRNFAQFLVQLHTGAVSVDNSRGVNPRGDAPS
ncbi:hypothetical protein GCM10019016_018880 [Streptomyces prasinosporus]|uniref:Uncharacterized protein n=1 Tax=Streptomyces prasinosporus TaxID=68256 RepID=A0ABP6TJU2_9ACTN